MKLLQTINFTSIVLAALSLAACSKMDATYDEFLEGGERIYVGKVDSVKSHAGNNRLQLEWLLISDPKISKYKVYWNNRTDSVVNTVQRSSGVDVVRVIIDRNLKEGPNNFEIITYDNQGNSSVKVDAQGTVYGSVYQSEIAPRGLKPIPRFDDLGQVVNLNWFPSLASEVKATEVTYTDKNNVERTVTLPRTQTTLALPDYKPGGVLSYRSYYIPEPTAIDTFVSAPVTTFLPQLDRKLDKSKFKEYKLPSDAATGFGWLMPRLWDGLLGGANNYATVNTAGTNGGVNKWFTFDLGETTTLSRYRVWQTQDRMYRDENAYTWEIWGTDNPDPDGDFDNWTKLMTCQSIRPSGLTPADGATAEDIAYAQAGQEFIFPEGIPPVRYIRIKVLKNYRNQTFMTFGEMTFWSKE